jgi:uncharacterized protein
MFRFRALALVPILLASLIGLKVLAEETPVEKVMLHVDQNDPKVMELALNNVQNLMSYYKEKGQKVQIEVIANGPGLNMLRKDTSPVKDRIATMALETQDVQFSACGNTLDGMTKKEGNKPPLISEAKLVPAGVVRIVELQKQGYAYIKP